MVSPRSIVPIGLGGPHHGINFAFGHKLELDPSTFESRHRVKADNAAAFALDLRLVNDPVVGPVVNLERVVPADHPSRNSLNFAGAPRQINEALVSDDKLNVGGLILPVLEWNQVNVPLRRVGLQPELGARHDRPEQAVDRAVHEFGARSETPQRDSQHSVWPQVDGQDRRDSAPVGLEKCRDGGATSISSNLFPDAAQVDILAGLN